MAKKVTIKDVAAEAGVSIGTVDRILHNRGRFASDTALAVQAAIQKLNYIPLSNKSTSEKHTDQRISIGICIPLADQDFFWRQTHAEFLNYQKEFSLSGIQLLLDTVPFPTVEAQITSFRHLIQSGAQAIIAPSFSSNDYDKSFSSYFPDNYPFATIVSSEWNKNCLFHIGPNEEAAGALLAKMISLYCGDASHVVILAPYPELEGVQKRITGFAKKIATELNNMNLLQIYPVIAQSDEEMRQKLYQETLRFLDMFPKLNAIYVTNGVLVPCANAIREKNSPVKLFGHEYIAELPELLASKIVCATVYQNPARELHDAIVLMANYLLHHDIPSNNIIAESNLLTLETLPMFRILER